MVKGQWVARAFTTGCLRPKDAPAWWPKESDHVIRVDVESNPKVFKAMGLPYRRSAIAAWYDPKDTLTQGRKNRMQYQLDLGPSVVLRVLREIRAEWEAMTGVAPTRIRTERATGATAVGEAGKVRHHVNIDLGDGR